MAHEDRAVQLAVALLGTSIAAIILDAALASFDTPAGFWTFMAAMAGFLGARSMIKREGNGS